jgi:hypothetical protein
MVIITAVGFSKMPDEYADDYDEYVINLAKESLINYYKIDPEVLYLQDVIVHEWE